MQSECRRFALDSPENVPKDRRLDILTDVATLLESPQIEHRPLRADATSRGGIFVRS
jgi:hypothetical protein